jgi:CBS domain-containing protein
MADTGITGGACPDISDGDIYEAMKEIPGYLDVTPADLKEIYRHAFLHAVARLSRPVKASQLMTRPVHHVGLDTPLAEVAALMAAKRISGVPVLDAAGAVAGVISEKDFLTRMGGAGAASVMGIVAACLGGKGCVAQPIRGRVAADLMAAPAITVREDATDLEIADLFAARKINRVPVVDASGRLAGIVSRADVLRARTGAGA